MSAGLWIGLCALLAGLTTFAGVVSLGIYLYDRTARAFAGLAVLALVTTAELVCGAVVLGASDPLVGRATSYVRAVLLALYAIGIVVAGVAALRHSDRWTRSVVGLTAAGFAGFGIASGLVADGRAFEVLVTVSVVPGGIASLAVAARVVLHAARHRETLARRQKAVSRLSRAAVTEPLDSLRRRAERDLRAELSAPDALVLVFEVDPGSAGEPAEPAEPADRTPRPTVEAHGRRHHVVARGLGTVSDTAREYVESVLRVVAAAADRAQADAEFAHRAGHDALTNLPNLTLFSSRLDDRLQRSNVPDVLLTLCRLDGLDRLAAVDGTDRMRSEVLAAAQAVVRARRPGSTVARVSGDVFAILDYLPATDPDGYLVRRLQELRAAVAAAAPALDGIRLGAVVAREGASAKSMVSDAFVALERTGGTAGDDSAALFDDDLAAQLRARVALERDLARAVERDEIQVRYQPIVSVRSHAVIGYEALARWQRDGETMPPAVWIPLAEHTGLIHDIGRQVRTIAARDQRALGVPVAVNVSPLELGDERIVSDVLSVLRSCPPNMLTLEITESAVMADLERAVDVLDDLRALGVRIALDDFGSSYSSLGALADLPVDVLKLDASFVARLDSPNGVAVIEAILALGRALGKPVIAEGVETQPQLDVLTELGVDRVQGFLFGRPASAQRIASGRSRPVPRTRHSSSVR